MTRIIQHRIVPNAEPPTVCVEVAVDVEDVAYIEALALALNVDDARARQLRMKVEQILSSEIGVRRYDTASAALLDKP